MDFKNIDICPFPIGWFTRDDSMFKFYDSNDQILYGNQYYIHLFGMGTKIHFVALSIFTVTCYRWAEDFAHFQ